VSLLLGLLIGLYLGFGLQLATGIQSVDGNEVTWLTRFFVLCCWPRVLLDWEGVG
jgi:hypothetical protein